MTECFTEDAVMMLRNTLLELQVSDSHTDVYKVDIAPLEAGVPKWLTEMQGKCKQLIRGHK